jgi:hypothetical protein
MSNEDLTLDDWDPDFNDGQSTVWAAEWETPEEEMTEEEKEMSFLTMLYKEQVVGRWYYTEIIQALGDLGIDAFLQGKNITDATDADKKELRDFFEHWLMFMDMGTEMAFEADGVEEQIGDDILEEMDSELAKLEKDPIAEAVKKTLH